MDYPSIEEAARVTVELLEVYPFKPLNSMHGKFAHVNFDWRKHDDPENPSKILAFCLEKLQNTGESKKRTGDFLANYLHSLLNGYREYYLDTVFSPDNVH